MPSHFRLALPRAVPHASDRRSADVRFGVRHFANLRDAAIQPSGLRIPRCAIYATAGSQTARDRFQTATSISGGPRIRKVNASVLEPVLPAASVKLMLMVKVAGDP